MKKRLLITSIVMMLVVAVALSTATYAWFTSSSTVTASTVTMTASTNSAAALGIGWTGGAASTSISTTKADTSLDPMAPAALVPGTTQAGVEFKTAKIKTVNDVAQFQVPTGANAVVFDNGLTDASKVETFYVTNLSGTNKISQITIKATIAADSGNANDGSSLVRVAVFKKNGDNNYVLVGVLAPSAGANTVVGVPAENKNATPVAANAVDASNPMSYFTGAKLATAGVALGGLNANGTHELKVLIWMDGQALTDAQQGVGATVALTFEAGTSGPNVTVGGDQVALDAE